MNGSSGPALAAPPEPPGLTVHDGRLMKVGRLLDDPELKGQIAELIFSQRFGKKSFNLDVPERTACMEALFNGQEPDDADLKESEANIVARYRDIEGLFPEDLTGEALPYFVDWLVEKREVWLLAEAGAHEALLSMMTGDHRATVMVALGRTRVPGGAIEPFLSDEDPDVRAAAIRTFAAVAFEEKKIAKCLKDADRGVRAAAAEALVAFGVAGDHDDEVTRACDVRLETAAEAAPLMAGGQFQPYVSAGAGWFTVSADPIPGDTNIDLNHTETGWNAGFGIMGFLGQLGVRGDLRYFAVGGDEFQGVNGNVLRARHGAVVDDQEQFVNGNLLSGLSFWRGNVGVALRW